MSVRAKQKVKRKIQAEVKILNLYSFQKQN